MVRLAWILCVVGAVAGQPAPAAGGQGGNPFLIPPPNAWNRDQVLEYVGRRQARIQELDARLKAQATRAFPGTLQPIRGASVAVDITPPIGVPLSGFGGGDRRLTFPDIDPANYVVMFTPSEGIMDPIRAKILVLDNGVKRVAFVSADTIGITDLVYKEVADRVSGAGIAMDDLFMSGTHSHSGPGDMADQVMWWFIAADVFDDRIFQPLVTTIAREITRATTQLEPVTLSIASGTETRVSINRRTDNAPVDTEVGVFSVDKLDGTPMAVMLNFAMHGTAFGASNLLYSPDVMGYVERYIEGSLGNGAVALYVNGPEGDVKPIHGGVQGATDIGMQLGQTVLDIRAQATPTRDWEIATSAHTFDLPHSQLQVNACDDQWLGWLPDWLALDLDLFTDRNTRVHAARFNGSALVTVPGEALTQVGMDIKSLGRSMGFDHSFVWGLSNGHISYIAPASEFPGGGYEVCATLYGTGLASLMVDECRKALQAVRPTATPTAPPFTPEPTDTPVPSTPSPTNTPEPTVTPRPTGTPMDTPTAPPARKPHVMVAGYMASHLSQNEGGRLNLLAIVDNPGAVVVEYVGLYVNGQYSGVALNPTPDEGVYALPETVLAAGVAPGHYLLEIGAKPVGEGAGGLWPYLTVE